MYDCLSLAAALVTAIAADPGVLLLPTARRCRWFALCEYALRSATSHVDFPLGILPGPTDAVVAALSLQWDSRSSTALETLEELVEVGLVEWAPDGGLRIPLLCDHAKIVLGGAVYEPSVVRSRRFRQRRTAPPLKPWGGEGRGA